MLHEEYPEIQKWRRHAKDLYPHFCQVQIPWDDYGGNGTDYFEIKQRNRPNQMSHCTVDPRRANGR